MLAGRRKRFTGAPSSSRRIGRALWVLDLESRLAAAGSAAAVPPLTDDAFQSAPAGVLEPPCSITGKGDWRTQDSRPSREPAQHGLGEALATGGPVRAEARRSTDLVPSERDQGSDGQRYGKPEQDS